MALQHISLEIKLLGFKTRKSLQPEDNVKHSVFIYPDEMVYIDLPLHPCRLTSDLQSVGLFWK
jgi:hypothetical protein